MSFYLMEAIQCFTQARGKLLRRIVADGDDLVVSEDSEDSDLAAVDEEGDGDDLVVSEDSEDSDLAAVDEEGERTADQGASSSSSAELPKLVEELAPLLQILSMDEILRLHIYTVCGIVAYGDKLVVSEDSNLAAVVGKLRLVPINEEGERAADQGAGGSSSAELLKLVEELARLLQIVADSDDLVISEFSNLTTVDGEGEKAADQGAGSSSSANLLKLVEELAPLLQILGRKERLRLYIDIVCESLGMEERLRPYIDRVHKILRREERLRLYIAIVCRGLGMEERLRPYIDIVCKSLGMEARLRPYIDRVCRVYEDPKAQEAARETVPVDELKETALVSLAEEYKLKYGQVGNFEPSKSERDHAFLIQLLYWFKRTFSFVRAPPCEGCGGETVGPKMGTPLPAELRYDCSHVEIYCCKHCSKETRFPRYNDPVKLLETKRGRCGELANCFTFYCRAFGYESRLVVDFTDHVWTECFSVHLRRWMHLDPCEGDYDKPLLYEERWNKKLNYAFGIAKDGIYDVTKCYTKKWDEVLKRRNLITETSLSAVLAKLTEECGRITSQVLSAPEDCEKGEAIERDFHAADDASESLPGRQSGDK
ncbi:hypothetical protein ACJRO7_032819 [Eucalyptus globulus]|uniref:Transglutaminase-like domain-containing protein n=1 Tax=Eucalyptus globulus TaxID=34317 RepID=A0ABD3JUX8_EUCGL